MKKLLKRILFHILPIFTAVSVPSVCSAAQLLEEPELLTVRHTVASAPQTFDIALIAIAAAVISLIAFIVLRKRSK